MFDAATNIAPLAPYLSVNDKIFGKTVTSSDAVDGTVAADHIFAVDSEIDMVVTDPLDTTDKDDIDPCI